MDIIKEPNISFDDIQVSDEPLTCQQCFVCAQLVSYDTLRCKAFPRGIPKDIIERRYDHTTPYPCDNGITFKEIEA